MVTSRWAGKPRDACRDAPRGLEILDELFAGFSTSLAASGAVLCDILGDMRWQLSGHQLRQAQTGLPVVFASRPFLEGRVRAMVQRLPEVRFLQESSVCGLTVTADKRMVTGVQVRGPGILSGEGERNSSSSPRPTCGISRSNDGIVGEHDDTGQGICGQRIDLQPRSRLCICCYGTACQYYGLARARGRVDTSLRIAHRQRQC